MWAQATPPPIYCDFQAMYDLLGAAAVQLRTDDNPPSIWRDAIYRAGSRLNQYLVRRYDPALLVNSYWAYFTTAIIAAYLLCTGRGNTVPSSLAKEYKDTIDVLQEIKSGKTDVPDVPARRQSCPVLSNTLVLLLPQPHVRVHDSLSTKTGGTPTAYSQIRDLSAQTDNWLSFPIG